jgi:hypothetical protein
VNKIPFKMPKTRQPTKSDWYTYAIINKDGLPVPTINEDFWRQKISRDQPVYVDTITSFAVNHPRPPGCSIAIWKGCLDPDEALHGISTPIIYVHPDNRIQTVG